jgi:hypothetical protein
MSIEYVVLWDGAHRDQDCDLLSEGLRIPEKVTSPNPRPRHTVSAALLAALPTLRTKALSFRELIAVTGLPEGSVNGGLYKLRQEGILLSETTPDQIHQPARGPQLYWRRAV